MFVIFELISVVFVISMVALAVTQIILPGIRGLPLFPIFRNKKILEAKIEQLDEEADEIALERQISKRTLGNVVERQMSEMEKTVLKQMAGQGQQQK